MRTNTVRSYVNVFTVFYLLYIQMVLVCLLIVVLNNTTTYI